MNILSNDNGVKLTNIEHLDIHQIFTSGQTFRFVRVNDSTWKGIAFGKLIYMEQGEGALSLSPCTIKEFEDIWYHFFDFDTDYSYIKRRLIDMDRRFANMISICEGVRILRQNAWEMLITFIISANNNIPRISKSVECLCTTYGKPMYIDGELVGYDFPTPKALAAAEIEKLRSCGLGYRDKYIKNTAQMVLERGMPTSSGDQLINDLLKFSGVGRKVADCIRLFGYGCHDAFPVDTWIRKAHNELQGVFKNDDEMRSHALNVYGELSGIAQQYLFYYIRHINKKS